MSRVRKPGKFMNENKYSASVTGPGKQTYVATPDADYTKAHNLSTWLFQKYQISYKAFRRKSAEKRKQLREEFWTDTLLSYSKYCEKQEIDQNSAEGKNSAQQAVCHEEYEAWHKRELGVLWEELRQEHEARGTSE